MTEFSYLATLGGKMTVRLPILSLSFHFHFRTVHLGHQESCTLLVRPRGTMQISKWERQRKCQVTVGRIQEKLVTAGRRRVLPRPI